jgi:hypothetical protein
MKMPLRISTIFAALFVTLVPQVSIGAPNCNKDLDACVRLVVAETAAFVEECGNIYPKSKTEIDAAFKKWSVLKLPIPGIEEALNPKSQLRISMAESVSPYLKRIPSVEKEIECSGRLEMVQTPDPTLFGDSVRLPPNALKKYEK